MSRYFYMPEEQLRRLFHKKGKRLALLLQSNHSKHFAERRKLEKELKFIAAELKSREEQLCLF